MNCTIVIKDFRIIKEAKLKLRPGLTLLTAPNGHGKSTTFKAIKNLLDGTFGLEENKRHGCDSYLVGLKVDDERVICRRVGSQTYLKYNEQPEVSKLGRGALNKLVPEFPLKRVETLDSSFYPNFSFQNSVPIFDDISVFDLFSAMFVSIGNVSARLDSLKKDSVNANKTVSDTAANLEYLRTDLLNKTDSLNNFNSTNPNFDSEYEASLQLKNKVEGYLTKKQSYQEALQGINIDRCRLLSQYQKDLEPILPVYLDLQEKSAAVNRVKEIRKELQATVSFPDVDFNLLLKATQYLGLKEEVKRLKNKLTSFPDIELVRQGRKAFDLNIEMMQSNASLEEVTKSYQECYDEVVKQGCPYKHLGVCDK